MNSFKIQAGDLIRFLNGAGGKDFIYIINEIQIGDTGCESIVIMQSLSRLNNQSDAASDFHQVPLPILEDCSSYELYRAI